MTYSLEVVDILDPKIEDQLRELYKQAFDTPELLPAGYLHKNTNTNASLPTYFVAAVEDGAIIGCNAFIPFDCKQGGNSMVAYQSGWTAAHPKHQGKRIFINIMNFAKEFLAAKGASFIFGVPNDNSHPILVKKLDFRELPINILRIPNLPFLKNAAFNTFNEKNSQTLHQNAVFFNQEQVMNWKQQENKEKIEVIRQGGSMAWGKVLNKKKFGINLPHFYIGGMHLENPADLKILIGKIFSDYRILFIQLVAIETNPYNNLLQGWKKAQMNGFIFFDLKKESYQNFNLMFGIVDVF